MSAELLIQAIEALEGGANKQILLVNQAMMASNQAMLAQQFELGMTRASEAGAATFKTLEESTANHMHKGALQVSEIPEIDVRPAPSSDGKLGEKFGSYMDDFNKRAAEFPAEVANMIGNTGSGSGEGSVTDTLGSLAPGAGSVINPGASLSMMQKSFQFRIETEVVSTVSRNTTKVVNDLMKGQ